MSVLQDQRSYFWYWQLLLELMLWVLLDMLSLPRGLHHIAAGTVFNAKT